MDHRPAGNSFADFPPDSPEEKRLSSTSEKEYTKDPPNKKKGVFWSILSLIGLILFKFKSLLVFLKFAKFGITAISMAATAWIYALFYGWAFAAGLVILIFLHEMGHAAAIRMKGIKTGAPVFIPFVGAFIAMKEFPKNVKVESFIAFGGPLAGAVASTFAYMLFKESGNSLYLALAYVGFLMNLFNLIPFSPLDGGRIVAAVSTKIWGVGLVAVLLFFLKTHHPMLLMILLFGAIRLWKSWKEKEEEKEYYDVEPSFRFNMGLSYLGLVIYLGQMTLMTLKLLNRDEFRSGLGTP
ncbi:MAG: site-2 protease family protein [Nitrospirae bacterium]|nr:site-2 protease family protein [Nitrospirota bacterium]